MDYPTFIRLTAEDVRGAALLANLVDSVHNGALAPEHATRFTATGWGLFDRGVKAGRELSREHAYQCLAFAPNEGGLALLGHEDRKVPAVPVGYVHVTSFDSI